MQAKKCDACGKLYECYHPKSGHGLGLSNGIILVDFKNTGKDSYTKNQSFDLCTSCMADLVQSIANKGGVIDEKKHYW